MKKLHMQIDIAITGIVIIIVGIIFLPESWRSIIKARPLSYGEGYLPLFSALSLCICGLIILWEAFQLRELKKSEGIQWRKIFRGLGISTISLIAYSGVMELVGFGIATFLLLVILLRIFKAYSWPITLIISGCVAISFHYIFRVWLFLPLPLGLLF